MCTASVAGLRSGAGGPAYSASKAGVINLVTVAAQPLCDTGVRVNAICPGLTETGMTRPVFALAKDKGVTHKLGRLNPLRRAAQPDELAQAALFLACAIQLCQRPGAGGRWRAVQLAPGDAAAHRPDGSLSDRPARPLCRPAPDCRWPARPGRGGGNR